ncbi:MAG: hypothetical protein HYZ53_21510 [Planctomycetes bacterium]|nr:hypothetical protein [Planctomycetota bacterium]
MDRTKIDAPLVAALDDVKDPEERGLLVFVHASGSPPADDLRFLEELGVAAQAATKPIFTATLSANGLGQLTDRPWVRYVRLSSKLRLVGRSP